MTFERMRTALLAVLCLAAWSVGGTAAAAPVSGAYTGTVSGYTYGPAPLDAGLPVGTSVGWSLDFDDAFRGLLANGNVFGAATQAVTGALQVGARSYTLEQMNLFSYRYDGATNEILDFTFQILGAGPAIAGGDFFGLWATFDRSLALQWTSVGFGFTTTYPDGFSITNYVYAETNGTFSARSTSVPEPESFALMGAALAMVGFARRRRAAVARR